jgi:hypothetical protein
VERGPPAGRAGGVLEGVVQERADDGEIRVADQRAIGLDPDDGLGGDRRHVDQVRQRGALHHLAGVEPGRQP